MHGDIGVKADVSNALGGNPKIDASACLNLGDAQVRAFGHFLVIWLFGHLSFDSFGYLVIWLFGPIAKQIAKRISKRIAKR